MAHSMIHRLLFNCLSVGVASSRKKVEAENCFAASAVCVCVWFSTIASTGPGSSGRPTPRQYTHIIRHFDVADLPQNPDVTENTNQNPMQSGPHPALTYYFVY